MYGLRRTEQAQLFVNEEYFIFINALYKMVLKGGCSPLLTLFTFFVQQLYIKQYVIYLLRLYDIYNIDFFP